MKKPKMRLIPLAEVSESEFYSDMAELAVIFNHDIVEVLEKDDERGRAWRWKPNQLASLIVNNTPVRKDGETELCFNKLVAAAYEKKFSVEEWMKFYMSIGYSICGFCEVFGQKEALELGLPGAKKSRKSSDDYAETIIEYMLRVHKGKVLKI